MSIKQRFAIGAITIILFSLLAGSIITYRNITASYENEARNKMTQIALDLAYMINTVSKQEVRFVGAVAKNPEIVRLISRGDYISAQVILNSQFINLGEGYEGLFITNSDGIIQIDAVHKNATGLDISMRSYFLQAKAGRPVLGSPVVSMISGKLIMVAAYPIHSATGEFLGIVGGPIKIDFMIQYISSIKIGETGYPSLVDSKGRVLLHPKEEYILGNQKELYLTGIILKRIQNMETGSALYVDKGVKKIAGYAPAEFLQWQVLVTQNHKEIMARARSILYLLVFGLAIFLGAAIVGVIILSGLISKPIEKTISTLSKVNEKSTEFILTFDKHKRIIRANQKAVELMGIPADQLKGRTMTLSSLDGSDDSEIWKAAQHGQTWYGKTRIEGANGKQITMDTMLVPLLDNPGHIYGYLEIGKDITHELEIEDRINQLQKMESIGTLAGGIAHDFNNILSGIFGYAQLSLKHLENPERAEKNIKGVIAAAERATELVKQILTFSRQTEFEPTPLKVAAVVDEAVSLLKASIPTSIEISLFENSDASVLGDKTQLHQVVVNLCTNAAHAIGDEKGTIDVILKNLEVDTEFAKRHPGLSEGPHVQITITDSGEGIEPEIQKNIFDPFFSTKPVGEGTGLGLSVVHGIVRKMNGAISVYSEPGEGSSFDVILPVVRKTEIAHLDSAPNQAIPEGNERILLVDDEKAIIESLHAALESLGYSVHSFTNSEKALYAFRNNPDQFDVIITDHTMPRVTGIDLAIEARTLRNRIPILMSSGFIDTRIEESARRIGITHLIKKPATIRNIALTIRKAIDEQ